MSVHCCPPLIWPYGSFCWCLSTVDPYEPTGTDIDWSEPWTLWALRVSGDYLWLAPLFLSINRIQRASNHKSLIRRWRVSERGPWYSEFPQGRRDFDRPKRFWSAVQRTRGGNLSMCPPVCHRGFFRNLHEESLLSFIDGRCVGLLGVCFVRELRGPRRILSGLLARHRKRRKLRWVSEGRCMYDVTDLLRGLIRLCCNDWCSQGLLALLAMWHRARAGGIKPLCLESCYDTCHEVGGSSGFWSMTIFSLAPQTSCQPRFLCVFVCVFMCM